MSQACISYSSLKDSSSEASRVSRKLNDYANNLDSQIYRKLNNYSGQYTQNIAQAKSNVSSKISDLRSRADAYSAYAQDLLDLREQCASTDKAVRSSIAQLTASFKAANGIKDSKVENSINYFLTSIGNNSLVGRWIGNKKDKTNTFREYAKQMFEDWWDYGGGAQITKSIVLDVLKIALSIVGFLTVVALLTSGAWLVGIAAFIAEVITLINIGVDFGNECGAYLLTQGGEPAHAKRRRKIDTLQDYLRSSYLYYELPYYADKFSLIFKMLQIDPNVDMKTFYTVADRIAMGIDVVNLVCVVISVVDSFGKLIKNSYQWVTKLKFEESNFKAIGLVFKRDFRVNFKMEVNQSLKNLWVNIKSQPFKVTVKNFIVNDVIINLKSKYWKFDEYKNGLNSVKSLLTVSKNLIEDGITFKNILSDIIFPSITIMKYDTISEGKDGQMKFDFNIHRSTLSDIIGLGDKLINKIIKKIPKENTIINSDILEKLLTKCSVSIKMPEIQRPKISNDLVVVL